MPKTKKEVEDSSEEEIDKKLTDKKIKKDKKKKDKKDKKDKKKSKKEKKQKREEEEDEEIMKNHPRFSKDENGGK